MPFAQIVDILNNAVEFHKLLEDFYLKVENASEKGNVKILTDYMANHEKVLSEKLSQITKEEQQQIKETWIKYVPEYATCHCFDNLEIDENTTTADVIDAGLTLNQCLINLYEKIAEIAPTPEIKTLFSNLAVSEIAEKKRLCLMIGI